MEQCLSGLMHFRGRGLLGLPGEVAIRYCGAKKSRRPRTCYSSRRATAGWMPAANRLGYSAQILGETLVVTTFGLGLGLVVAAQFPLLGVMGMKTGVYLTAMLLATGLIYALTTLCALYPSRLAAGIHPAVALREE